MFDTNHELIRLTRANYGLIGIIIFVSRISYATRKATRAFARLEVTISNVIF